VTESEHLAHHDPTSTRTWVSKRSALIPPELVRRAEATLGVPVAIVFGMTELCGIATQTRLDDAADDRAHTIGQPLRVLEPDPPDAEAGRQAKPAVAPHGPIPALLAGCGSIAAYNGDNPVRQHAASATKSQVSHLRVVCSRQFPGTGASTPGAGGRRYDRSDAGLTDSHSLRA
jgi:acyl-coenzyme A synthetase/AMP-(fatty) acid ligase